MKLRNLGGCLLGLVVLTSAVYAQANKASSAEQAVAALEEQWLQSQRTNNADLMAAAIADKIAYTSGEGKLMTGKAPFLAESRAVKWTSVDYSDTKVTAYGDAAIATGVFSGTGTDGAGKALNIHERYTDTWVKMPGGKWQCVATQGTPIK